MVVELEKRELLGVEPARAALVRLAQLGHTFLPVNAELLHGALRDSRYEFTPGVAALYDRLAGTDLLIESVASVFAELMRRLALDPLGWAALPVVAQVCIERITRGRRVDPTLKVLGAALEPRLRLLPEAADAVWSCMQRFQEAKRRGKSLW